MSADFVHSSSHGSEITGKYEFVDFDMSSVPHARTHAPSQEDLSMLSHASTSSSARSAVAALVWVESSQASSGSITETPVPSDTATAEERVRACLARPQGDGVLVEWGCDLDGLFALLGAAAQAQRVLFPSRWLPARRQAQAGCGDEGRLLALARGDASLHRLFGEEDPELAWGGMARPDEPLALLGVPGDVVTCPEVSDPTELRRRAEFWIQRLGFDRVALAIPVGAAPDHPLLALARQRNLPVVAVAEAGSPVVDHLPCGTLQMPLLTTDFQLDTEHRLPDDAYVPGLRDLLHRGSLLRERVLYERLPAPWREQADAELRALYSWHVSPLVRRLASLLQTLAPVAGVQVEVPLPEVQGVCAWLLGFTDRRPEPALDPVACARSLATELQRYDRRLRASVAHSAWGRLQARLSSWAEGGHLAACPEAPDPMHRGRRFCFSGQPLWLRGALSRDVDGFPRVGLSLADRRALGWFELELLAVAAEGSGHTGARDAGRDTATIAAFPFVAARDDAQLSFELDLRLGGSRA